MLQLLQFHDPPSLNAEGVSGKNRLTNKRARDSGGFRALFLGLPPPPPKEAQTFFFVKNQNQSMACV